MSLSEANTNSDPIVGGYVASWAINSETDIGTIPADQLTHLFYAFADVDAEGNVKLNPNNGLDGDIDFLQALKEQNPNLKILVSLGGGEGKNFPSAASDENRQNLVNSAIDFMKDNGFDGIDVDWEFPKKEENENFTKLMAELRQQIDNASDADGEDYQLTTALPASPYTLSPAEDVGSPFDLTPILKSTADSVDFINAMTYDYYGTTKQFDTLTGHQAALDTDGINFPQSNIKWGINQYLNAGVPPEKVVLGVPLYGRAWIDVNVNSDNNNGLFQPGTLPTKINDKGEEVVENTELYNVLHKKVGTDGFVKYWDDNAQVPYIYSDQERKFHTYENQASVEEKVKYVEQNELGGMFFWQLAGDLPITDLDSLVNVAATNLLGSSDAETLIGGDDNDMLQGTKGDDLIAGLLGDDFIEGGNGNDILRGDANSRSPGGEGGNDTIRGALGDDRIGGKAGNDLLLGDGGDDLIWGDDGDDTIRGGMGNDTLTGDDSSGGQGVDTFVLAIGEGTDLIVDFEVGIDKIGLAEGLSFEDLTFTPENSDVKIMMGEEILATVVGVTESELNFVVV